jgi:phage/plasmid-associated DNA primase
VGQLDNFQVMPFLLAAGGTCKSLVLSVVEKLVGDAASTPLPTTYEEVFGLANLCDADLVVGRDVPQRLSKALSEADMRSMASGEPMTISRKRHGAVKQRWTAPLIMAGDAADA